MHYSYTSLAAPGGGVDHHNRCLGNRAWCVKVGILYKANTCTRKNMLVVQLINTKLFQDICGIVCVIMTWLLILFAEFVVCGLILLPNYSNYTFFSTVNMVIFQALAFLAFVSHLRTMLSDPVSLFLIVYVVLGLIPCQSRVQCRVAMPPRK